MADAVVQSDFQWVSELRVSVCLKDMLNWQDTWARLAAAPAEIGPVAFNRRDDLSLCCFLSFKVKPKYDSTQESTRKQPLHFSELMYQAIVEFYVWGKGFFNNNWITVTASYTKKDKQSPSSSVFIYWTSMQVIYTNANWSSCSLHPYLSNLR